MFDEILNAVKAELGNHPDIAGNVTPEQADAIHTEIANHINDQVNSGAVSGGGLLGTLENALSSGSPAVTAIEGGVLGSLTSRFGLPPAIPGAISAALPGLIQKFANKQQAVQ